MTQPIIIQGQENAGKTRRKTTVAELASRIRNLEEEVDGVEPPKSKEMQKIEELEEKINKLLMLDSMEADSLEDDEEKRVDSENKQPEEPEQDLEIFTQNETYDYNELDQTEVKEAIIETVQESEQPLTYFEIARKAFGEEVDARDKIYKSVSKFVNSDNTKLEKVGKDGRQHKVGYNTEIDDDTGYNKEECPHCGGLFDSRGINKHKENCEAKTEQQEEEEDSLNNTQKRLLNKLNQRNFKGSKMLAAGLENHERLEIQQLLKEMKDQNLLEAKRGYGHRLTEKGKKKQENIEIKPEQLRYAKPNENIQERTERAKEIWKDQKQGLTRRELASKLYGVDESDIENSGEYYVRADSVVKKLRKENELREVQTGDQRTKSYILKDVDVEEQENSEEDSNVSMDWEEVKRDAGVSDKDVAIVTLAFEKMVERKGMDEIDYYDFEKHFTGDEKELRMFQKLFENPNLLEGVRKEVSPGKDWSWKKRSGGNSLGAKSWVIKIGG